MTTSSSKVCLEAPGKWILAGEHSVLRGCPALVFPLYSKRMRLEHQFFSSSQSELQLVLSGEHGKELELIFWGVFQKASEMIPQIAEHKIKGNVSIHNEIPLGAGLGASAALSVLMAKWFCSLGYLATHQLFDFALQIENLFHEESSGVDIAVSLSSNPIKFLREGRQVFPLKPLWKPYWYLSYSGQRGATYECVKQVKSILNSNSNLGQMLDLKMKQAVEKSQKALCECQEHQGLPLLAESIQEASFCFEQWGLTEGRVDKHIEWLCEHGAIASKPTGSGKGGYVLSLWDRPAPQNLDIPLIPIE